MMTAEPAGVTGGVDTHADVHVAAVVCSTSHRLLGVAEFETTPVGYVATYDWLASFGPIDAVGIEGAGSYGAGLARFLAEQGWNWWRWPVRTVRPAGRRASLGMTVWSGPGWDRFDGLKWPHPRTADAYVQ